MINKLIDKSFIFECLLNFKSHHIIGGIVCHTQNSSHSYGLNYDTGLAFVWLLHIPVRVDESANGVDHLEQEGVERELNTRDHRAYHD